MEPVPGKVRLARRPTRLGDFTFVVGKDVVLTPGMEIDDPVGFSSEQGHGHHRTFQVPAGIAFAPRAGPLHDVTGVGLPEHEVGGVLLDGLRGFVDAPAFAGTDLVRRVARQPAVRGE